MTFKDLQRTAAGWDLELVEHWDSETDSLRSISLSTFEDLSVGMNGLWLGTFLPSGFEAHPRNFFRFISDFDEVEREYLEQFLKATEIAAKEILRKGGAQ
jgi:hypothetical protein